MRRFGLAVLAISVCASGTSACAAIRAAKKAVNAVEGNKATIDAFTHTLTSGPTTFEVTYVTTGAAPATVVYAVKPPKGLFFTTTPSAGSGDANAIDLVVNSAGAYSCSARAGNAAPTCQKLGTVDASAQEQIYGIYTPSHWTAFLRDFALAAGLAGDKVTSSTKTVNGFSMQCVDFEASGVPGTSTICTTAQGILGYVQVASDSTSFEIKSYSGSPPDSLFELPAGATVTNPTSGTN